MIRYTFLFFSFTPVFIPSLPPQSPLSCVNEGRLAIVATSMPMLARLGPLLARSTVRTGSKSGHTFGLPLRSACTPPSFSTSVSCTIPFGLSSRRCFLQAALATSTPSCLPLKSSQQVFLLSSRLMSSASGKGTLAAPASDEADEGAKQGERYTTRPIVAYHLFFCAALVYCIIVVGGLTRLTESGLSITEWNPGFKGMRLPWTAEEWDEEWEKYKRTPEWAMYVRYFDAATFDWEASNADRLYRFFSLNRHMDVDDFKKIYMWEWSHRILGRVIGVAFVVPAAYFLARRQVARGTRWKLVSIALGIGFQGALGWFMVKSGLSAPEASPPALAPQHPNTTVSASPTDARLDGWVSTVDQPSTAADWHPRVSHFRLAAHLGTAFLVYLGMLHTGAAILRDDKVCRGYGKVAGVTMTVKANVGKLMTALADPRLNRFRNTSRAMFGLTFVTAMTGALVAGLDAGLVYSEFPYMGEGFVPPREELLDPRYASKRARDREGGSGTQSDLIIGNATQNPVTVQLIHRCLAITTLVSAVGLGIFARRLSTRMARTASSRLTAEQVFLPPSIPRWATLVAAAATAQATLGVSTLIYLVPIQLASAHQAGSVALLSTVVALLAAMRRPSSRILQQIQRSSSPAQSQARQATIARALDKVAKPR